MWMCWLSLSSALLLFILSFFCWLACEWAEGLCVLRYELFSCVSLWRSRARARVCVCAGYVSLSYIQKKISSFWISFTSRCSFAAIQRVCQIRLWHRQQWRYKVVFCTISHTRFYVAQSLAPLLPSFAYQISFCLFKISIYNKHRWCVYYRPTDHVRM